MDRNDIDIELQAEGYEAAVGVIRPANYVQAQPLYSLDAEALVTAGEIMIAPPVASCSPKTCRVGDRFKFSCGVQYIEYAGPAGVTYLLWTRKATP